MARFAAGAPNRSRTAAAVWDIGFHWTAAPNQSGMDSGVAKALDRRPDLVSGYRQSPGCRSPVAYGFSSPSARTPTNG
ncbi:MAG: hypothetical protein JF621_09200 [Streptomyces turgidiscabies]|nr:hypothetical protein [Streptomyces turgidiscabies]